MQKGLSIQLSRIGSWAYLESQNRQSQKRKDKFCSQDSTLCKENINCSSVNKDVLTISSINDNLLQISIKNHSTTALIDTGASVSCISEAFCRKIFPNLYHNHKDSPVIGKPAFTAIRGVCGETHPVKGTIELQVNVNGLKVTQSNLI